ncbi:MAG TPA: endonuclease/exonuclease/phosphatase family protein [Bacteroidota bacterium]|nr:endonuclease/exonuclease/phosphatase family protein [Bacteroidota bacterium]
MNRQLSLVLNGIFAVAIILIFTGARPTSAPLRVMTFNIRWNNPDDEANKWENRRANLVSMIRFHKADLVGLQEAKKEQLDYIMAELPEYGWYGVGRDDGTEAGEYSAVIYRKARFDTLATATFWCSETPERPGMGWDAACPRVVTYGKMKDRTSGKIFYMFNTHLDHMGEIARVESAKLIKNRMQSLGTSQPIILTGDFNSPPASPAYAIITAPAAGSGVTLVDSRVISAQKHHGPAGTFTDFKVDAKPLEPIDFIFVKKGMSVLSHGTLSDSFDGFLPSDHYPVLAEIAW